MISDEDWELHSDFSGKHMLQGENLVCWVGFWFLMLLLRERIDSVSEYLEFDITLRGLIF